MRPRIYMLVALFFVAFSAQTASAEPERGYHVEQPGVMQEPRLTADRSVHTWTSRSFGANKTIFIYVYVDGRAVPQVTYSTCNALYEGGGLIVRVHVVRCGHRGPITATYVSLGGSTRFKLVISSHDQIIGD